MADAREQMIIDVRRYITAGERLAAGITEFVAMNSEAVLDIEAGMTLTESFRIRDSAAWSRRVSSLLDEFEARRRDTRSSAAALLLEEGRSVTDVGRAFGVSHQLASRFAKSQPESADPDGNAPDTPE